MLVSMLPERDFLGWGWRLPFLVSAVLVVVGLVIRLSIEESPALVALKAGDRTAKVPVVEVLRSHPGMVALAVCAASIAFTAGYFKNTFAVSWATTDLGFARESFLTVVFIASVTQFVVQPFGAILAHRWDIRKTVTLLLALELVALPLMFVMIATGDVAVSVVGMVIATVPHVMFYAILAGMLAQAFPVHIRYTGMSLAYGLAGMLLGGTAPLIGQALLSALGSIVPVVVYALVTVLMSLCGARALPALSARRAATEPVDEAVTAP